MAAAAPVKTKPAFELKSASLSLLAFTLKSSALDAITAALDLQIADAPGLYDREPVVIDLTQVRDADPAPDITALVLMLRDRGLLPVAVKGGNDEQNVEALALGLAEAPELAAPAPRPAAVATPIASKPASEPPPELAPAMASQPELELHPAPEPATEIAQPPEPAGAPTAAAAAPTLYVSRPLRSGQQVYARGGDLVVLAVVNDGAEVIADGTIHVYAPLRGRAVAGARGDTNARIFATCMEPQLVSIAGTYLTIEADLPANVKGRPAQVRLEGDRLVIEPLARPAT